MDDERLRSIFSSLAILAQHGEIPVQAYSVLVTSHQPEVLAEQLHQRWLSDGRFANIAANIIFHVHKMDTRELALSSCVLALLLNDYRSRLEVRNRSRSMFRNSVRTLFAMYPVYVKIDECVAKCFVKPMFKCLDMLISCNPDAEDVETMALLLSENGCTLNILNSHLVDRLIVQVRDKLCSDEVFIDSRIRRLFLHVIDLWTFRWSELMIPDCLTENYSERRHEAPLLRKNDMEKPDYGSKESIV